MHSYLEAARLAADHHPYPGLTDDGPLPPLSGVYVRQQAADGQTGTASESTLVPAETVFAGEENKGDEGVRVLLAGAGGGKSTLLRRHLADTTARWLGVEGDTADRRPDLQSQQTAVPVMIRATALAGAPLLAQALATAVTETLGPFGLRAALTEEFFRTRPHPAAPWLVLVDGLDEVPDHAARAALLDKLARESRRRPAVYRFLVATRPLPYGELDRLGPGTARLVLQPFTPGNVLTYARACFARLPDPDRHVKAFKAELRRSRFGELACTPLIASILCQLYAADPARPLPEGRTGAYQSFVELLYEQNTHKAVAHTHDAAIRFLKDRHQIVPDSTAAEQAAPAVRDQLPELINLLAHERISGNTAPAVEILAAHLPEQRPPKVKEARWHAFLGDLLRPTGLLAQRAGDFGFLHQSLLEYHAAQHATRDEQARLQVLEDLFPNRHTPTQRWKPPEHLEASYLGFLFDGLLIPQDHVAEATARALEDANGFGDAALEFLATQVGLRTCLPAQSTARKLTRFVEESVSDLSAQAAAALVQMDGHVEAGVALLSRMAAGSHPTLLLSATVYLARVDGHEAEGVALLTAFTTDPALLPTTRAKAAAELSRVEGHAAEGLRLLAAIAANPRQQDAARLQAAQDLARREGHQQDGIRFLAALTTDARVNGYVRTEAARRLAQLGDARAAGLLLRLSGDTTVFSRDRVKAAQVLSHLDGYRQQGADLLVGHIVDATLQESDRLSAAVNLAELGDSRGADLVAKHAADPAASPRARAWLSRILDSLGKDPAEGSPRAPGATGQESVGGQHDLP